LVKHTKKQKKTKTKNKNNNNNNNNREEERRKLNHQIRLSQIHQKSQHPNLWQI